jgi:hypothetical protein
MTLHLLVFATCLLYARLCYLLAAGLGQPVQMIVELATMAIGVGSTGWLLVRLVEWWGEEAPVFDPRLPLRWSRVTYREAKARLRLIELFEGDGRMARRQVRILMAKYPQQTEQWCWEHAVLDFERSMTEQLSLGNSKFNNSSTAK